MSNPNCDGGRCRSATVEVRWAELFPTQAAKQAANIGGVLLAPEILDAMETRRMARWKRGEWLTYELRQPGFVAAAKARMVSAIC